MGGPEGEKAAIARLGLDVFARLSVEEAQRLCTDDVQAWTLYDQPGHEPMYHGHEGLRLWFARLDELWAFIEILGAEIVEVPGNWVLITASARVRGRGSPDAFDLRVYVVLRIPDRLVDRFGLFVDEGQARAMIASE